MKDFRLSVLYPSSNCRFFTNEKKKKKRKATSFSILSANRRERLEPNAEPEIILSQLNTF